MQHTILSPNLLVLALSAFIPLVIGFIWYNDMVFGKAWLAARLLTEEREGNLPVTLISSYILSLMLAFGLQFAVIHQFHIFSILINEPGIATPGSPMNNFYVDFMTKYGHNFRTFKHGAFHGVLVGIFMALPVAGINALHEGRGIKYLLINGGFWILSLALMGAVICHFT